MPTKKTAVKNAVKSLAKKVAGKKVPVKKKPIAKQLAKKAAPKKTAVKKAVKIKARSTKLKTKKVSAMKKPSKDLVFASDQESFWVQNGEILNSLMALRDAFAEMEKDVYKFHATGDQNDFSIWVGPVLCDSDCAADIAKAKTQKGARTAVVKHLKLYVI